MLKFTDAKLRNGRIEVTGPATAEAGKEVKYVHFMLAQDGKMVEDKGWMEDDIWKGDTPAEGLKEGIAQAFGLAVIFKAVPEQSFETYTWIERLEITTWAASERDLGRG